MERRRPEPQPEEQPIPYEQVQDYRHEYEGYWLASSVCRIRIFTAPDKPPVVIASALDENPGTSVTNMAEVLGAEILARFFPERFETDATPMIWIEHYARTPWERTQGWPEYARVDFASYRPRIASVGRSRRLMLGQPTWTYLPQEDLEQLIGPLAEPEER